MFNQKKDYESDFCESYKSQILSNDEYEEENSLFSTIVKLLTIVILLAIITGVSFYGYNYFMNSQKTNNMVLPPVSMQISDEDLVVEMEEETIEPEKIKLETIKLETIKPKQIELEKIKPEKIELVKEELPEVAAVKEITIIKKEEDIPMPLIVTEQVEELDIEKIANDVKIAIAKSELKEENETKVEEISEDVLSEVNDDKVEELESLEVPTSAPEAKYLEDLADLSKEIDKERNP